MSFEEAICKCRRCGKSWTSDKIIRYGKLPVQCSFCKSPQWNVPRKRKSRRYLK